MATKTEYEISKPRKVYVESEEVFNQMKEQGLLQPFTDYYTPDDDTYGVGLLVAEITAVGGETNLVFNNLDIASDGGVYDFEISCPSSSPNIRMKASNDGGFVSFGVSGNWNGATAIATSQRAAGGVVVANVYNGCMLVTGTIKQHSNYKASVIAISESGNTSGASDVRCLVTCGYFNISSNITSITFTAESNTYYGAAFAAGQKIRIYKRATNSPTRPQ